jgi:phosphonoacetate hydrolase
MTITVNGRSYAWPTTPLVVVCVDGSEPNYMDDAVAEARGGARGRASSRGPMSAYWG